MKNKIDQSAVIKALIEISEAITDDGRITGRINKTRFSKGEVTRTTAKGGQFALPKGDVVTEHDAKIAALYNQLERIDTQFAKRHGNPSIIALLRQLAASVEKPAEETPAA